MTKSEAAQRIAGLADGTTGDYVAGELVISRRPAEAAHLIHALARELGGPALRRGSWRFRIEPQLYLGGGILMPALAGWRQSRMPPDIEAPSFSVEPFWVAEVIVPENARLVRATKMPAYALATIEWVWLVDPFAHMLEVYRRIGDRWLVEQAIAGEKPLPAPPFTDRTVDLGALWPAAPPVH